MSPRLPNLFRSDPKNASRIYQMFLGKLLMDDRHDEVIAMCRRIRRLAPPEYDKRYLSVFYLMEVASLAELKRYDIAWRQLRRAERARWNRQLDLTTHRWRLEDTSLLTMYYAPLLYHRRKYELGTRLLEKALALLLRGGAAADARMFVAGPQEGAPTSNYGVTLLDFYEARGEDIRLWKGWDGFIDGLPRRYFAGTGFTPPRLKEDTSRLRLFIGKLKQKENVENRPVIAEQRRAVRAFTKRNAVNANRTAARIERLFGAFL